MNEFTRLAKDKSRPITVNFGKFGSFELDVQELKHHFGDNKTDGAIFIEVPSLLFNEINKLKYLKEMPQLT